MYKQTFYSVLDFLGEKKDKGKHLTKIYNLEKINMLKNMNKKTLSGKNAYAR